MRVMDTHAGMSQEEIEMFVKLCCLGPNLTEQQKDAKLETLGDFKQFDIKKSLASLYNL